MGVNAEDIELAKFGMIIGNAIIFFLFVYPYPTLGLSIPHSSITGRHLERERAFRESADHRAFCRKWRRRKLLAFLFVLSVLIVAYLFIPISDVKGFMYVTLIALIVGVTPDLIFNRNIQSEYENLARKHGLSEWQ